jgi:hypothetical protein
VVWRKRVSSNEDDTLHVLADGAAVPQQTVVAHKLEVIDRWGKVVTIFTVVYLILFGVLYFYQVWVQSGTAGM